MNSSLRWILGFLVILMFVRFGFFILGMMIRFWYITIPVILYIVYSVRKKVNKIKKTVEPDKPIDADFTVIDEEE